MEKNSLQLNKNSEIRKQQRTKFLFVGVLAVLVVAAGVIGFLRRREFQIADVVVDGARATDANQIRDFAKGLISGNYAFVIPKTNALIFSKSKTEDAIMEKFPGLRDVTAEFPQRNHLVIHVVEKEPAYVWCDASCWFVDADGVIYDDAPKFSDGVYVAFAGTASDSPMDAADPRRGRFASAPDFNRITQIITALKNYPAEIFSVAYLSEGKVFDAQPTGQGDIAIRIGSLKGFEVNSDAVILITNKQNPETIMQSLELVVAEGKFSDSLKSNGANLQYIDLRFDGKIYYKFSQEGRSQKTEDVKNGT